MKKKKKKKKKKNNNNNNIGPPIKHIPRSARHACSSLLSKLVCDVVEDPHSVGRWQTLLSFASHILSTPKRGGRKRNIGNLILKRISGFPDSLVDDPGPIRGRSGQACSGEQARAKAAIAKLEDGNIRAAVKILSSNDEPAADTRETLDALYSKHPAAPADLRFLDPSVGEHFESLQVEDDDVRNAISSFPPGSAGGMDSLLPQHLKDMTGVDGNPLLLSNLTRLVNIMLQGTLPDPIAKILYGGNLIALTKKMEEFDQSPSVTFTDALPPNAQIGLP